MQTLEKKKLNNRLCLTAVAYIKTVQP